MKKEAMFNLNDKNVCLLFKLKYTEAWSPKAALSLTQKVWQDINSYPGMGRYVYRTMRHLERLKDNKEWGQEVNLNPTSILWQKLNEK